MSFELNGIKLCFAVACISLYTIVAQGASQEGFKLLDSAINAQVERFEALHSGRVKIKRNYTLNRSGRTSPDVQESAMYTAEFRGREFLIKKLDSESSIPSIPSEGNKTILHSNAALGDGEKFYSHVLSEDSNSPIVESVLQIRPYSEMGAFPNQITHPFRPLQVTMANHLLTDFVKSARNDRAFSEPEFTEDGRFATVHVINQSFDMAFTIDMQSENSITRILSKTVPKGELLYDAVYHFTDVSGLYLPASIEILRYNDESTCSTSLTYKDYELDIVFPENYFELKNMALPWGTRIVDLTGEPSVPRSQRQ